MRIDSRLIGFGLFFIVFGGILLAGRQGLIEPALLERAWQLWPLLLVAAGLSIVLARRPGADLGNLLFAVVLGVMAGGLVGSGAGLPFVGCGGDADDGTAFPRQGGSLADGATVEVDFSCGDLMIVSGGGSEWSLTGTSEGGASPEIDEDGDTVHLEAGPKGFFVVGRAAEDWELTLPTEPAIALDLALNAGSGSVDLDGTQMSNVEASVNAAALRLDLRGVADISTIDLSVNAGSAVVWLPEHDLEGDATANAGSLTFCAPDGVGLRFVTGGAVSSNDFGDNGLEDVGEAWESPDFSTADVRITIEATANAGSLSLNDEQACEG
jgi:Domain of unknown function (DUF5668)